MAGSGAPGEIDGEEAGCAEGSAPRNGGGGVLVWTVTSSLRPPFSDAVVGEALPISGGLSGSTSCSRVKTAPAVAARGQVLSGVSGSTMRTVLPSSKVSSATGTRACGRRISCTSISGDHGANVGAAAACSGAAAPVADISGAAGETGRGATAPDAASTVGLTGVPGKTGCPAAVADAAGLSAAPVAPGEASNI